MKRTHYAWTVAAVTFCLLIAAAAIRSTPTMMIQPLEQEFGWSAATVSFAIAVNIVLFGLVGPFAAAVMERFGIRRTVAGALALLALGTGLSAFMRAPWEFVASWGVLVGLGTGTVGLVLGATVVNRWFETRRGLVMGALTASNATGQLLFLPLFGVLVQGPGWRTCVFVVAGVALALIPLSLVVLRERPSDLGLPPYGADAIVPPPRVRGNAFALAIETLGSGLRKRDFWLLAGSFFICGASTNGLIGTHLVPACGDHGIPEVRAAGLLAAMGVFDLVGTTASGWLSDRFDSRYLLVIYYVLRGISLLFLPTAFGIGALGLPAFAVFYGLDWIATVPPTLKLVTNAFGRERAAVAFGWIAAAHQLGAGLTAEAAGAIRTVFATYDPAFIGSGVLCLIAAALVLFVAARRPQPLTARAYPSAGS